MTYEQMPDEWQEWLELTPIERFRESEKIFAHYLAMRGGLIPTPIRQVLFTIQKPQASLQISSGKR